GQAADRGRRFDRARNDLAPDHRALAFGGCERDPHAYLQPPDAIPVLHGRRYRLDQGIDRVGTFGRGGAPADLRRLVALPIPPRPHARDRAWHVTGDVPRLLRRFVAGAGRTADGV